MLPITKKVATADPVLRAFNDAPVGSSLSDDDRVALEEAVADPQWIRMNRGEAFERLVCEPADANAE